MTNDQYNLQKLKEYLKRLGRQRRIKIIKIKEYAGCYLLKDNQGKIYKLKKVVYGND